MANDGYIVCELLAYDWMGCSHLSKDLLYAVHEENEQILLPSTDIQYLSTHIHLWATSVGLGLSTSIGAVIKTILSWGICKDECLEVADILTRVSTLYGIISF